MEQQPNAPEQHVLSIVLINPKLPLLVQSVEAFKSKRPEPVVIVASAEEAAQKAAAGLPCVLIFSIVEDADVIACIQMSKTLGLERRDGLHRLIVVSVKDNKKLQDSVLNRGASEFVNSKTAPSGLVFKTTRLLAQIQKQLEKLDEQKIVMTGPNRSATNGGMVIVKGPSFNMSDEVIAEDNWVINSVPPKKVGSRWAVEIEGPDADSGNWEPLGENERGEEQWAWHPFGDDGKPLPAQAKQNLWIFTGQRPSYDLESEKWKMVSAQPELFYQMGKQKGASKFKLDQEKGIIFSQDIPPAAERIAKSKVIGNKVRQERMQQMASKTKNSTGVHTGGSANTSSGSHDPAEINAAASEAPAAAEPDYAAVDSVGVLRGSQKEVPLDRVPCEEFGHPAGNWEAVKQQGWAFVTPEMKTQGMAGLGKLAPFWLLDKKQNGSKPYFDSDSNSWLFEKSQMPRKVDKFDDLAPVYQDFLASTAKAQMSTDMAKAGHDVAMKQETERTNQKFESIRYVSAKPEYATPLPDRPHKTPLNFFFKISQLVASGLDSAEIVSQIAANTRTVLPIESIAILRPSLDGDKSKAIVVCSTTDRLKEGRVLELEKMPFKDALTDVEPRTYNMSADLCIGTYPILDKDLRSTGSVLLFYTKGSQSDVTNQRSFIDKVTTQLSRIYLKAS